MLALLALAGHGTDPDRRQTVTVGLATVRERDTAPGRVVVPRRRKGKSSAHPWDYALLEVYPSKTGKAIDATAHWNAYLTR
jgi:hypothetical protein